MKEFVIYIIICFSLIAGLVYWIESAACGAAAADISLNHRYRLTGTCQIEIYKGRWISIKNYRATQ
jgi:hypothetical protein